MSLRKPRFEGEQKILEALNDKVAVAFVSTAFKTQYKLHFSPHGSETQHMIDQVFITLLNSQKDGQNYRKLEEAISLINGQIFKNGDLQFWFNQMYANYKKNIRPKIEFNEIKKYLVGRRILDYGSGSGCLALELEKQGYSVSTMDIIDYRFNDAKHLPFTKIQSSLEINKKELIADTILVKAVLHHVNQKDISLMLDVLRKMAKRIIIEESTYGIDMKEKKVHDLLTKQPIFGRFTSFDIHRQFLCLVLICFLSNALAFGISEMNLPFQFKTVSEWKKILEKFQYKILYIDVLGFQSERITPDSRVLFVCNTP